MYVDLESGVQATQYCSDQRSCMDTEPALSFTRRAPALMHEQIFYQDLKLVCAMAADVRFVCTYIASVGGGILQTLVQSFHEQHPLIP